MNCLDFHRLKLADPRRLPPEAQAHAEQCPACMEFARDVDATEQTLQRAVATPVPEGLADRVLLRAGAGKPAWRPWALAAALLLALGISSAWLYRAEAPMQALEAIAHVKMEPESFRVLTPGDRPLEEMVRAAGGTLKATLGEVRYVKLCPVESGTGWHIVLQTPEGLATLFLVPGRALGNTQRASSGEWAALARPTPAGYYAVVAPSADKAAAVDRLLRERIDWRT